MIFCGSVLLILLLIPVLAFQEKRREKTGEKRGRDRGSNIEQRRENQGAEAARQRKKDHAMELLEIPGEWLYRKLSLWMKETPAENERRQRLLISNAEEKKQKSRIFGLMWGLVLLGALAGFITGIGNLFQEETVSELIRPAFGEEEKTELSVNGLSEKTEVEISVSGQIPDSEGMEQVFSETFEEMKKTWLSENDSEEEVRSSLNLTAEAENGIRFSWRSGNIDAVTDYGTVLSENIPEEGLAVTMELRMNYEDYEKEFQWQLYVLPPEEEVLTETEKLKKLISETDRNTAAERVLRLPTEIDGRKLVYRETQNSPYPVFLVFLTLSVIVFILPGEKRKEDVRKRNEEMERTLPGILSKLETLTGAGLSIRGAWFRIADDYEKGRKDGTRARNFAYEEVSLAAGRIRGGVSEREAYVEFGRRCGLHSYVKLGNLLSKSLRQGISGLSDELREEMEKALALRKEQALRKGETAGTKLLLPMILMLGIVIIVLIVPAFMSF